MAKLMLNCKEASAFVSRALDDDLPLVSRVLLKVHLLICRPCAACRQQIELISAIGRQHRDRDVLCHPLEGLSPEACQRIQTRIDRASAEIATSHDAT